MDKTTHFSFLKKRFLEKFSRKRNIAGMHIVKVEIPSHMHNRSKFERRRNGLGVRVFAIEKMYRNDCGCAHGECD